VDKIRRVGTILLELIQKTENEIIKRQGNALFEQLLDMLTKLDSKASDVFGWET
jgi:hypothetical protein